MTDRADGGNRIGLASGVIVGVLLVSMATLALLSAAEGFRNGRADWGVGWGLVGVLLLAAGSAAVIGTLWHRHRVAGHR